MNWRWLRPWVGASALLWMLPGCTQVPALGNCGDLGATAEAQKVEAFLATGARFETQSRALTNEVEATCRAMARDLGLTVRTAGPGERQVVVTCEALSAEIESIVDAALPAGSRLDVEFVPPRCSVAVDAMAQCVAECDVNVSADVAVTCTEGRLVGGCSGTCMGECSVRGEIACDARCEGTCTGSCTGTCVGACDGECSAVDGEGNCIGTCSGTCNGSCTGSCSGSCSGTCVADVSGSCTGTCAGSCDVDFVAPRCEGQAQVQADAQCQAACEADVSLDAQCTEPSVAIYASAEIDPAAQARLVALVETLRVNYPRFLALTARLAVVAESGAELVRTFNAAADAAGRLSFAAGTCFAATTARAVDALATVSATVTVTVEVNASVSASAR
jgi:hypothetical protein